MKKPLSPVDIMIYPTREGLWSARITFSSDHMCHIGPTTFSGLMYLVTRRIDHEVVHSDPFFKLPPV